MDRALEGVEEPKIANGWVTGRDRMEQIAERVLEATSWDDLLATT